MIRIYLSIVLSILIFACSCSVNNTKIDKSTYKILPEVDPLTIPMKGNISKSSSEISSLCWYKDFLLLLPQYPNFISKNDSGIIYYLKKKEIINFIDGNTESSLSPKSFKINLADFEDYIGNGSGFEGIATINNNIYITIENMNFSKTESYLVSGIIDTNSFTITLDKSKLEKIPAPNNIFNMSCETIASSNNRIIPIYEANGKNVNSNPNAYIFDENEKYLGNANFPTIEYRITDATKIDSSGKFWAINYSYPGEEKKLKWANDLVAQKFGIGKSHIKTKVVERLLEFQYSNGEVKLTGKNPIYFKLLENDSRNWEGIVKLDKIGFLVATDTFPRTILAFIKYNFE
jgi:hypothetical protein